MNSAPPSTPRRLAAALLARTGGALELARGGLGDLSRLAAFARGRLEFSPRASDIYVASYPRSGTTWVLHMAHLLTRGAAAEFEHLSQVCPWFERGLAVGAFTAAELNALPAPRVFKSHLPRAYLPRPGRFIYMARDVEDVALSYYHFYRSHLGYTGTLARFIRRFLDGDLQYRDWARHVAGWEAQAGDPAVCVIEFESLRADPGAGLERLARFLGVPLSPDTRAQVLERCSFAWMKAHEHRFDFAGEFLRQRGYRGGQFLRRGEVGQGKAEIPGALRRELRRAAGKRAPGRELRLADFLH